MEPENLRQAYSMLASRAERMRQIMVEQVTTLLRDKDVPLGVPMESRVKDWSSIQEKIERKSIEIDAIEALPDLIGLRVILLFREDLERVDKVIRETFNVVSREDKAKLLGEAQFGYQSLHYQIKLPAAWCAIPTMIDLGGLQVEVQVRTIAQHIWAAASHKLQYKHETSVPPPIRRTINRVSALLETIDLEFDRVLAERRTYQATSAQFPKATETLNVDLVKSILADIFPPQNSKDPEDFEDLLEDLSVLSIQTVGDLKNVLTKNLSHALAADQKEVKDRRERRDYEGTMEERIESGVFFSHTGLARAALRAEFGSEPIDKITLERMTKKWGLASP